jgi:membrane protease YdiL (CAAX protease family)
MLGMMYEPTHIVGTCPHCGHGNVFAQPYPYHAGYGYQGFLYNETGDCTLTWSSFDREYAAAVGSKQPWELTAADREALEDRLTPAPDGTRWLFRNPARCRQCRAPISGPITDTIYYLRNECTVDRDVRSGWGSGLRDVLGRARASVPWRMRDVWLGVLFAVVLSGLAYGAAYLLLYLLVDPDVDLWLALFSAVLELVLLVPVWWFVKRKYHVPLAKALGFRRFKPWWLAVAVGSLIAYSVFNAYYAAILAALGLEMQRDVGPTIRELSSPWPLVFSIVILAPLVEEVFFRGFVFNGLRGRMDWWWAAVISGALFAAAHLDPLFLLPAFLIGFMLAFLYQKTNSIWPGMIVHFLVNSLAVIFALTAY